MDNVQQMDVDECDVQGAVQLVPLQAAQEAIEGNPDDTIEQEQEPGANGGKKSDKRYV